MLLPFGLSAFLARRIDEDNLTVLLDPLSRRDSEPKRAGTVRAADIHRDGVVPPSVAADPWGDSWSRSGGAAAARAPLSPANSTASSDETAGEDSDLRRSYPFFLDSPDPAATATAAATFLPGFGGRPLPPCSHQLGRIFSFGLGKARSESAASAGC